MMNNQITIINILTSVIDKICTLVSELIYYLLFIDDYLLSARGR